MSADVIPFPDLLKLDYAEILGECQIILLPIVRIERGSDIEQRRKNRETPMFTLPIEATRLNRLEAPGELLERIKREIEEVFGRPPTSKGKSGPKP